MDQLLLILAVLASPSGVCEVSAVSTPPRPAEQPDSKSLLVNDSADVESRGQDVSDKHEVSPPSVAATVTAHGTATMSS